MKTTDTLPLVSIVCESYNHEPFLRRCLDGFVMQKTDFPFEILIHDDASTDRSADIIREYESKYPGLFKPIYQKENQYSKGVKIWADIQFPRAKGKYIALCEGDDYWTDPLKLQKQVDYLEAHPDCSACFHNAVIHWYDRTTPDILYYNILEERDYTGQELFSDKIPPTASLVLRTPIFGQTATILQKHPKIIVGDVPLCVFCVKSGKIHALTDFMSVYGKHKGGWTQFEDAQKTFLLGRSAEEERTVYGKEFEQYSSARMTGLYLNAMVRAIKQSDFIVFAKSFYRGIIRQPLTGLSALFKIPQEKRKRLEATKR